MLSHTFCTGWLPIPWFTSLTTGSIDRVTRRVVIAVQTMSTSATAVLSKVPRYAF